MINGQSLWGSDRSVKEAGKGASFLRESAGGWNTYWILLWRPDRGSWALINYVFGDRINKG